MTRKRYLIDGIGLVSWLFWEFFPCKMKNIIFAWRGAREVCLKWTLENSELGKTQISFLGGGEHWWVWQGVGVMQGGLREVGYARWITWGGLHEIDHTRWVTWGGLHKVDHVRWITQGGLREVGYARWITRGTSHLVKCFTPWYLIRFFMCIRLLGN